MGIFRRLPPLRHYAATVLPPRRNGGVKAEQELLSLARLCGFLLGINSGLVKNTTDFSWRLKNSRRRKGPEDALTGGEEDVLEVVELQELLDSLRLQV